MERQKINLDFLRQISNNDDNLVKEMVFYILEEIKASDQCFEKAIMDSDWEELARAAHKLRSSVMILKFQDFEKNLLEIETRIRNEYYENFQSLLTMMMENSSKMKQELCEVL